MQFKSFMEALKGKQHKIDKNKNNKIDAHDFKLLRKEESEERMARADYKVGASGRKSHKEIVFNDVESKDDKEEMKEAKMSDADMAERERIVKGMKKNLTGFKARYGDKAKEVMYATATKQAMKEETVEEAVQKADIPAYLRKQQGQTPLKLSDLKRKDTISDKENLAKLRGVKEENELEEGAFTDDEGIAKKLVAKHGKNVQSHDIKLALHMHPEGHKTTVDRVAGHVKRMLSVKEEVEQIEELTDAEISKLHSDAASHVTKSINKASDARIAALKNPPAKKGFFARVGQKQINMVRGAYQGLTKEETEQLDEKSEQAKRNKIMKNMMDASRGARHKLNNPVPDAEPEHKTARAHNVAIGRALRSEEKKDDVPFDGPYTKAKPAKNSDGTTQQPMSRARQLAKDAMKKQMKEDIDRLFEKDEKEYGYEGDMAMNQLATLTRCAEMIKDTLKPDTDLPEWVQSKITLATDYIVTAADYLHSELEEQALKGNQHKIDKNKNNKIDAHDFELLRKESFDADGNIINSKVSYKEFAMMLEYEAKDGRYTHKGSYGGSYVDPEGADDADDKKPKQQPAEKRGRGRPAGAKSGAGKITGTSKLYK
jgi:hypothetical protein